MNLFWGFFITSYIHYEKYQVIFLCSDNIFFTHVAYFLFALSFVISFFQGVSSPSFLNHLFFDVWSLRFLQKFSVEPSAVVTMFAFLLSNEQCMNFVYPHALCLFIFDVNHSSELLLYAWIFSRRDVAFA